MKSGKNFVIQYNTGAYELAKSFIRKTIYSHEFQQTYAITRQDGVDDSCAQVDTVTVLKYLTIKPTVIQVAKLKFTINFSILLIPWS